MEQRFSVVKSFLGRQYLYVIICLRDSLLTDDDVFIPLDRSFQKPPSGKAGDNYYTDDTFPACNESIFRKKKVTKAVVWKRPQV